MVFEARNELCQRNILDITLILNGLDLMEGTFADDGNMLLGGVKKSGFFRQNNREEVEAFTVGKSVGSFPRGSHF